MRKYLAATFALWLMLASVTSAAAAVESSQLASNYRFAKLTEAKTYQAEMKSLLSTGGLVVVEGAKEADLESLLGIKIPVRIYKEISADKQTVTPLSTTAIGVTRNSKGGYHLVTYVGPVDTMRVRNDLQDVYLQAGCKPGEVSTMAIANSPCYSCTTGQVNYDYKPYGQVVSAWALNRTIDGEHIWTAHFSDNISPGHTLKKSNSAYKDWSTNYFRPRANVNYSGQAARDADPQSVSSDGTFGVTLGYKTAYATWSWTIPAVKVTESCDWVANNCSWVFNYRWLSNAGDNSSKQQPGMMATNTKGNFVVYHYHSTEWVGLYSSACCYATSTDGYTLSVPDF